MARDSPHAGYCAGPTVDNTQSRDARLRNKSLFELVLLVYLYQVEGTTLEFWVVAVTTISYMPAFAWAGVQRNQKMPSTALYYLGFKYIFDMIFLRPHIVAGMATAFAIWASCWGFSCPDDAAADSQEAELQRSQHKRFQLKGIAYLAFCIKVMTGLGCWAAAHKEGYMGVHRCWQWISKAVRLMMPSSFWCYLDGKGPSAASDAQNLLSVSLLIAVGSCVSTLIEAIQTACGAQTSAGKYDVKVDKDIVAVPHLHMPKGAKEEEMLLSQKGIRHAAWSVLQFLPAELLYTPCETHAHLQQKCLLSLISAIITKIEHVIEPWYEVDLSEFLDVFLATISSFIRLVVATALSIAVTVFCFWFDIFLDVTATNIQATFQALSACVRLGTFAVGVPVAVALGLIKNGGSVEDLFDEPSAWQTASKIISRSVTVIGQCLVGMACTSWTVIRQQLSRTPEYDSPETQEILASIRTGKAHSQAKRTAPVPNKQCKIRPARTAKAKASKTPMSSEVSTAAPIKPQPKLERELQGSPMAAEVPDAARQSLDALFTTDWKPALTSATLSADKVSPVGREDVKDLESVSARAQYSSPVREDEQELEAGGAAKSHQAVQRSSLLQSSAHLATAPATPTLAPHSHAQPAARQQATLDSRAQPVSQPQAPASKAATAGTSTASEHLTTPAAAIPHTGTAAVTPHSAPAQFPHLFPAVPPGTPKIVPADELSKQHKPSAHSLVSSLPSSLDQSQLGAEARCAHKNAYVTASDKAADGHILFQHEPPHTESENAVTAHSTEGQDSLSNKSSRKAAGLPDGPSIVSGLAGSAPSVADEQPCIDQDAGSDDGDEASKCIICWTTDRETTLAPCGHRVLCRGCTTRLLAARKGGRECICPFCRTQVDSYILKQLDV